LAAGARAQRTQLLDLARAAAAGTALAWDRNGGGGECLSAPALHRRVQSPLPSQSGTVGQCVCALSRPGSGARFCAAIRAHGEPGQHGQLSEPDFADRARALAGCAVIARQHLDGTLSLSYGPHRLGRYDERGAPILNLKPAAGKAVEKTRSGKVQKPTFPPRLEIPQSARDSHFPTASAAATGD